MADMRDFGQAYLMKVQRDVRAAELLRSIRCPDQAAAGLAITMQDVDALALAFERCTADEAARWVARLLSGDEFLDLDDLETGYGEDVD